MQPFVVWQSAGALESLGRASDVRHHGAERGLEEATRYAWHCILTERERRSLYNDCLLYEQRLQQRGTDVKEVKVMDFVPGSRHPQGDAYHAIALATLPYWCGPQRWTWKSENDRAWSLAFDDDGAALETT